MARGRSSRNESGGDLVPKLSERIREFRESPWEPAPPDSIEQVDLMWGQSIEIFEIEVATLETESDAWKEAFNATRAYYRNNTGPNAKRYREAKERLKELKLIK